MKRPLIDQDLEEAIQLFANKHFNGNFTKAVNYLVKECIKIKDSPDSTTLSHFGDEEL